MATAWEYRTIISLPNEYPKLWDELREAGRDGWEAVSMMPMFTTHFGGLLPRGNKPEDIFNTFTVLMKRPIG